MKNFLLLIFTAIILVLSWCLSDLGVKYRKTVTESECQDSLFYELANQCFKVLEQNKRIKRERDSLLILNRQLFLTEFLIKKYN